MRIKDLKNGKKEVFFIFYYLMALLKVKSEGSFLDIGFRSLFVSMNNRSTAQI